MRASLSSVVCRRGRSWRHRSDLARLTRSTTHSAPRGENGGLVVSVIAESVMAVKLGLKCAGPQP